MPKSSHLPTACDPLALRILWIARVLFCMLALGMVGILGRVVHLQLFPPEQVAQLVGSQTSKVKVAGRRGFLLDRKGRIISATRQAVRLFVDTKIVTDLDAFSSSVAQGLGADQTTIRDRLMHRYPNRHVVLAQRLTDEQLERLAGQRLRGLGFERWSVREYPQGDLASQLIGFTSFEGRGAEGLELVFDRKLTPKAGQIGYLRDAGHRPLWADVSEFRLPQEGENLQLSLDLVIQEIAQQNLEAACRQYAAQSGQMVVMQPGTGEILAMANYPEFDLARLGKSKADLRRNRCVTDTFEPGSTFKPFIWSMATELGVAKATETIDCTTSGLWVSARGRRLRDAHPNGRLTWEHVLVKSSNIGMAIVGQRMTHEQLYGAVKNFGFAQYTGAKLPGESPGMITPLKKWTHYSVTSVPMGQEVAVTALQAARGYSALANGGKVLVPTVLALDPNHPELAENQPNVLRQVISPKTAAQTLAILRKVVTEGTGQKANSNLYAVFGKTGTAQIADHARGGYQEKAYVGSFCGGAPAENPQIIVVCFIQRPDPRKGYYGGIVAAPAVRQVIEQTLLYLGVPASPTQPAAGGAARVALND